MTTEQLARLQEWVQEVKDCHNGNSTWTHTEWCDYVDAWTGTDGYIKNGGERPPRPHPL